MYRPHGRNREVTERTVSLKIVLPEGYGIEGTYFEKLLLTLRLFFCRLGWVYISFVLIARRLLKRHGSF
jgi:hypothetical protein